MAGEVHAGVAKIASAWAFLEFSLIQMFYQATGDIELGPDGEPELVGHPLAHAALASLESTMAKLDVIASGLDAYVPVMSPAFEQLRNGIRTCARERNRIVHAIWGTNQNYPDDIIRVETFSDKRIKYTPQDFDALVDRIKGQVAAMLAFEEQCRQARIADG